MKDSSFQCPACGKDMVVKSDSDSDMGEDHQNMTKNKVVKQPNTATMPMSNLKSKISQVPGMPQNPTVPPNLNSY
jgi:hypothetical protein